MWALFDRRKRVNNWALCQSPNLGSNEILAIQKIN